MQYDDVITNPIRRTVSQEEGFTTLVCSLIPRDVMRKRGLCCRPVYVRSTASPSVTFVYCIQIIMSITLNILGF